MSNKKEKSNEKHQQEGMVKYIQHNYPDSILATGFDSAIVGVSEGFDRGRIIYDISKMADHLVNIEGMMLGEAYEYLEFNVFGAFISEDQPIYVDFQGDY
tara:strand:- start:3199 stop:3498 length:300 start_codon:yes stop_codon:yes gene_type:complete